MNTLPLLSRSGVRTRRAARLRADPLAAGGASRWLGLQPGAAVGLELAPGDRVQVLAGRVWLTEPGDAADHFIGAGQCHLLGHGGRVVMECDGSLAARVRLEPARPAARGLARVVQAWGFGPQRLGCWLGRLADLLHRHRHRHRSGET